MGKGENKLNFMMAALFIFQTFPPLFLGSFGGDLVGRRFLKFNCIADFIRCGCDCFGAPIFCVYSNIR